jgi:hypothetical protein
MTAPAAAEERTVERFAPELSVWVQLAPPPPPVLCTVQACVAGVVSALPAASVAATEKEWEPTAKPL